MLSKKPLRTLLLSKFMAYETPREVVREEKDDIVPSEENAMFEGEITPSEMKELEPEEREPVFDSVFYLDDQELAQEFENDVTEPIAVYFCFYKIIDDLATPFLEVYLEKKEGSYVFPSKIIQPESFLHPIVETSEDSQINEENKDGVDVYEMCVSYANEYMTLPDSLAREFYKGFLEINDKNILVVWNCTDLELKVENKDATFAILDEILHKEMLFGAPIDAQIGNVFREHEYMKYILDKDGHPLPMPTCMYQVEKNGLEYETSVYQEGVNWKTEESGFDASIEHPIFGDVYLFSLNPMERISSQNIKRVAVFTQDVLYIMNKNFELEENIVAHQHDFRDFSGVSFYENGAEYMAFYTNGVFLEI